MARTDLTKPPNGTPDPHLTPEEDVVRALGVSHGVVREFRGANSEKTGAWFEARTSPRRGVWWTAAGVAALKAAQAPPPGGAPPVERLLVARGGDGRFPLKNPRLVYAYRDGGDPEAESDRVYVRVRDNANFRPLQRDGAPMTIPVVMTGANTGELPSDQRLPRRKGEW